VVQGRVAAVALQEVAEVVAELGERELPGRRLVVELELEVDALGVDLVDGVWAAVPSPFQFTENPFAPVAAAWRTSRSMTPGASWS